MLFAQIFSNTALVASFMGLCGIAALIGWIAKSRLGYSWSYSATRRRS